MCFYFLEYAARSAPAVMIPHLSLAFGTTAVGVGAILGTYYYTYSITSLIAGAALDRFGAKKAVPIGIFILAMGCLLFSQSSATAGIAAIMLIIQNRPPLRKWATRLGVLAIPLPM